jgi:hypothetical protein
MTQWLAPSQATPTRANEQFLVSQYLEAAGLKSVTISSIDGRPLARAQSHMDLDSGGKQWVKSVTVLDDRPRMTDDDAENLANALFEAASIHSH